MSFPGPARSAQDFHAPARRVRIALDSATA